MLSKCLNRGEVVFLIEDFHGHIFGGYTACDIDMRDDYYGTGESFLFKVSKDGVSIYGSTLANSLYIFCDGNGLGFGSDPHFGLFIDQCLTKGSSHACKTYSNDVLTTESHFGIHRFEVWGFKKPDQL